MSLQENRAARVLSADDGLLFHRMTGSDGLSELFEYRLELLSDDPDIKLEELLGKDMTVVLELPEGERFFNGIVSEISHDGIVGHRARYHAVLRPWLWLLTRWADCRIFQNKTVPQIVKEVLQQRGFTDVLEKLSGTYEALEYCVQYRETDFNFISRLLEQEGIYYYFQHEENKHTLVLADSIGAHAPVGGYATIPYFPPDRHAIRERDHVFAWGETRQVRTATYTLNDFHFPAPKANLVAKSTNPLDHGHAKGEVYDYPGKYEKAKGGETLAKVRLEEAQARYRVAEGEATARGLAVGALFTLSGFPRQDQNVEHLIVSASYELKSDDYLTGSEDPDGDIFLCRIGAIPSATSFRPSLRASKPTISGPQTAIVVGKAGEEIWTDEHGRVKLQFHWDRLGTNNENSSCWVRVAQVWAGKSWGGMFIPRIGQEVIVEFLEGDPDRPIITGRVYNGDNKPPAALPANATQSTIKSNSSKGGNGFNELRFEDKKDAEEVFFHAQKDFKRVVRNNDTLEVGKEEKSPGDQTIDIHNNRTVTLEQGNDTLTVKTGNRTVSIDKGNDALTVKTGNRTASVDKGNDALTVKTGNRTVSVDTGNHELTVKAGNQTTTVTAGSAKTTAGQSIELKVGGSSIKIDPTTITLSAPNIKIQGQISVEIKGVTTQVSGDGMLVLKGGMVMIN